MDVVFFHTEGSTDDVMAIAFHPGEIQDDHLPDDAIVELIINLTHDAKEHPLRSEVCSFLEEEFNKDSGLLFFLWMIQYGYNIGHDLYDNGSIEHITTVILPDTWKEEVIVDRVRHQYNYLCAVYSTETIDRLCRNLIGVGYDGIRTQYLASHEDEEE